MSQEQLSASISQLSLDATTPGTPNIGGRKSKRPNRAFHTFAENQFSSPQVQPNPEFPGASPIGVGKSFTPMQVNTPIFNNVDPMMQTPNMNGQEQFNQFGSPYTPKQQTEQLTTSHIIATQRWEDQLQYLQKTFETARDSVPPLPTTQFYCADQRSCDPRLMSLSMYNVPEEEHLRSATKLPLGLTIQPFAPLVPDEPVPIVSGPVFATTEDGLDDVKAPLRCRRCRAYINPNFQFGYDSTVKCNICQVKMRVPEDDFAPIGQDGQRSDINERMDLLKGCVDFLVPRVYNTIQGSESVPLHYVFVIDVSSLANENGSSLAYIEGVRSSIEYIVENQEKCKVAIIAYDNKLRFYNLKPDLEAAQEYIVGELNDVFLPFYQGMFVAPKDSMNIINDTLRKITDFVAADKYSHIPQNCYGSALEAAKLALNTVTGGQGGKIICSLNSLPTTGNGNLSLKKDDATKNNVSCDNEFYNKLSFDMLRSYISLDLYVTSAGFIDMASVGAPVKITSGKLKYYPHFRPDNDEFTLINDMVKNVATIVGYQALLKVRTSSGLSVDQYYSEAVEYSDRDPIIPVLTKDTTLDVLLKYDEKLKAGNDVYFQTALLYTDINGVRKVRSINCSGAVSNNIHEIFKFVNQNSVLRIMIKDIIRTIGDCDFSRIRSVIDNKIVDILTQYRALVNGNSSSQLVLPDALKTLPMYLLAFEKSELMRPNKQSTRGNSRINDLIKYNSMNPAELNFKLYPQIIPFHVLLEEEDLSFYDANDKMLQIKYTSLENVSVRNAHTSLVNGGSYFIFDGETVYLWFNENTNRMLLEDLLGMSSDLPINQITLFSGALPETGTNINEKAANVIRYWCQATGKSSLPIILLRPNIDQYYSSVLANILTEDKTVNMIEAYDNYLVNLHRLIQEKLKKEDFVKVSNNANKNHETFHQKFVQF